MTSTALTRLAMVVAGLMLAHQFAAKAIRDTLFLSSWPAEMLPRMVIATVAVVLAAVPLYAKLLTSFSPRRVVPVGFLLSGAGHLIEWQMPATPLMAAIIYLHVAGLGTLLLSGFWSLVSERFDSRTAKSSFGRIAAAGTLGGLGGGLTAAAIASTPRPGDTLLFLAALHAVCAAGVLALGRAPETFPTESDDAGAASGLFRFDVLRRAPHLRTLAAVVVLSTASAFVVDYLLKAQVATRFATDANKLRFFAWFYTGIGVVTFLAQASTGQTVRQAGIGRTIATLPIGLGSTSAVALVFQAAFPLVVAVRAVEAVLRGSLFRGGYELLFVPMAPAEKRRAKTFLDVTCDRGGDALGAGLVQAVLLTGATYVASELLALAVAMSIAGLWIARRLDALYLGVVERQLVRHVEASPVIVGSETGWTVLDIAAAEILPAAKSVEPAPHREEDPKVRQLGDLRSGDRARVERALDQLSDPARMHVAQLVELLAWDDLVGRTRTVLERVAGSHVGLLVDALLDPSSDFAIRRRLPRILGTVTTTRAVEGLLRGLDDARFEVRYQCGRALERLVGRGERVLPIDAGAVFAAVERELSVSASIWQGHRLIDHVDGEEESGTDLVAPPNLRHVFTLLSTVLPREPLQVAYQGIQSEHQGLRALALEYLERVLPPAIQLRLWALLELGDRPPE